MTRENVLERLRKLEAETKDPWVSVVIAFIDDGQPVDESLLDGFSSVVRTLISICDEYAIERC